MIGIKVISNTNFRNFELNLEKLLAEHPDAKVIFGAIKGIEGGKGMVVVFSYGKNGAVKKVVEVEVIKEVIKEIEVDNPELLEQIQTLQDALADALNAEQIAKKEAEDLKKQIPKLKASVAKFKKILAEE